VPPAEEPEEMPLPADPKVIFLGGLFALALLAAVSVAADIVLPLGGHSPASGAVEFLTGTHQHAATVFAAGGRLWTTGRDTGLGLGERLNAYDEAFRRHPGFCQRVLYDHSVSPFPACVW
jgi:hypothetical protein